MGTARFLQFIFILFFRFNFVCCLFKERKKERKDFYLSFVYHLGDTLETLLLLYYVWMVEGGMRRRTGWLVLILAANGLPFHVEKKE